MFSIILPGRPCSTEMHTLSPTQFAFQLPLYPLFSHVVVFIIPGPGNVLPPDTAAAVYMQLPGESQYRFLGAVANEKPSAVFRVRMPENVVAAAAQINGNGNGNVEGMGMVSFGISVESVASVKGQMERLQAEKGGSESMAMTTTTMSATRQQQQQPSTKILAQRIIKNAFNFLASFAGAAGGQEVVPLKSFEEWWRKFERRVEIDPTFLERDQD